MKIAHIIKNKSIPGEQVAFETEPPLTKEIFEQLEELGYSDCFYFKHGLLVMPRDHFREIEHDFRSRVDQMLTEANRRVEENKTNAKRAHDTFVNTISQKTGIPVAESAQNAGHSNQE